MKYEVYIGSENTMRSIAEKGVTGLNPKTMRMQRFAKEAKFEVVKDGEFGWMLLSDTDIYAEAENKGLILGHGRKNCSLYNPKLTTNEFENTYTLVR